MLSTPSRTWHPCVQMKDFQETPPLTIVGARGAYLMTQEGRQVIDAIASWWCKSLGHQHPALMAALREQTEKFEHVILANSTYAGIEQLSETLSSLFTRPKHVFYASEGSSAVEIALKIAVHAQQLKGKPHKNHFVALAGGYHGETCLALSVSDVGMYRQAYESLLSPVTFLQDLPYVFSVDDPLWENCESYWPTIQAQLATVADNTAAIILEPIVQGAGGMRMVSPDLLRRLRQWCDEQNVILIFDEIMTGCMRTGKMLASMHANVEPDICCLSKGLTGGVLPLSVTIVDETLYQLFYDDYHTHKAFLHSHTYSGNALAVAVANATLAIMQSQTFVDQLSYFVKQLHECFMHVVTKSQRLANVRMLGGIVAADLVDVTVQERVGYRLHQQALARGALLRPLGHTVYWLPPLTTSRETLQALAGITYDAIMSL